MANSQDIIELRRLIHELDNVEPWTDVNLAARIDATEDIRVLAATIWREKAATYAGLVDVKEGSSDRKLSQMYRQALDMATALDDSDGSSDRRRARATTRPIERI